MLKTQERMAFDARFAALAAVDPHSVIAEGDRHAHSIKDVGVGGVLRVGGETFVVDKTSTYTKTEDDYKKKKGAAYVVTELVLFSLKTGETRYIEWVEDDEVDVSFTEKKYSLGELNTLLHDDEGGPVNVDNDIDEYAEEEWALVLKRVTYPYDDDWAFVYEDSKGRKFKGYMYEFGSKRKGWLTIEGWKDGKSWDYEGYVSHDVDPRSIEIISVGGDAAAAAAA